MNNKKEISRRERILLSAYIDGQLSGRDREKVEKLLRASSVNRSWMENLRRTKALIGMLPVRRVPRNFTISMEEVKQPSIPSFLSVLRYATVAAALLLVIVLGIDFLPGVFHVLETTVARDAQPEMLAAELIEMEDGEPTNIIFWGGPPMVGGFGKGGGGGDRSVPRPPQFYGNRDGGVEGVIPEVVMPEDVVPLEEAVPSLGKIEEATPLEDLEEKGAAEPAEEEALEKAVEGANAGPILGLPPADQRGKIQPTRGFERSLTRPQGQLPFRTAEIVLAALLALLGIPAWLLSRRKWK